MAMRADLPGRLFTPGSRDRLESLLDIDLDHPVTSFDDLGDADLASIDVLITSWGTPRIDAQTLDRMPRLAAAIHAAGSVKHHLDQSAWNRGILVTSAAAANARPVAEYALAMILLAGKSAWELARDFRHRRQAMDLIHERPDIGNYGRTIGIVGASSVGRELIHFLRAFDLEVLVSDPFADAVDMTAIGAKLTDLPTLLASSSIVSLHAPLLPETTGMIGEVELALMRDGACLINTARGGLVDEMQLRRELRQGRLRAILDVTEPEPLPPDDELYTLGNVLLTPHIAGAFGNELGRIGELATDQVQSFVAGERPVGAITIDQYAQIA